MQNKNFKFKKKILCDQQILNYSAK